MISTQKPPKGLSVEARKMWRDISMEYGIDDSVGLKLLQSACESYDIVQRCQAEIRAAGVLLDGKVHPLLAPMRDARSAMLQALKSLNCDLEPLRDKPGRPGGRK